MQKSEAWELILKKARGYEVVEVAEERIGKEKTKIKTVTKFIPPDMAALKMIIEEGQGDNSFELMTNEELQEVLEKLKEDIWQQSKPSQKSNKQMPNDI